MLVSFESTSFWKFLNGMKNVSEMLNMTAV